MVFHGFSELRDSNCLSKVGQFQFEDGVLFCVPPTRSSQLESNCLCKFCLKGTCSRLDFCNFLYLKAVSEPSILQAFGCDPKGPKGPRWPWGASPELFFQKRSWEVGSIKFFLATRHAIAFREFGGPCHYVLSGKFERVCQSGSSQILGSQTEHTNFPRKDLKSVH